MLGEVNDVTSLFRSCPSFTTTSLLAESTCKMFSWHVLMSRGQTLARTEISYSVSFFYLAILSEIVLSESLRRSISFLLSDFRLLTLSRRVRSRSLMSLVRRVERFSMILLCVGPGQPAGPTRWLWDIGPVVCGGDT